MNVRRIAAIVYAGLTAITVAFQVALALGAPWGSYAMGGAYPGQFPPALRVSALVQALILVLFAAAILARAGLAFPRLAATSRWLVWIVVAFTALSLALNLITPSTGERAVWAPVAFILLACSLLVAAGPALPKPAA